MGADVLPDPIDLRGCVPPDLLDDLHAFMCARMDRMELRKISADYRSLEDTAADLYGRIEEAIPEGSRGMLSELYECYTSMSALSSEMYYRHGFSDGVRLIVAGCAGTAGEKGA